MRNPGHSDRSECLIRPAGVEDAEAIAALVMRVFDGFIAPDLDAEGRAAFARDSIPEVFARRLAGESDGYLAVRAGQFVGVIEMRGNHLKSLFVAGEYQGRGIARRLLARALAGREGAEITVNASPYAEAAYQRLGFRPTGDWTVSDGLRHRPMLRRV